MLRSFRGGKDLHECPYRKSLDAMSNFKVGQRVVCVNDGRNEPLSWERGAELTNGLTYTISAIFVDHAGDLSFTLIEVKRGPEAIAVYGQCVGYRANRFRPLIEDLTASLARTESERWLEEKQEHVPEPQPQHA
jgi:hypothetical protein